MLQQKRHRGVEPVFFAQLQSQTFMQRPCKDAARVEALKMCDDKFKMLFGCAELLAQSVKVGGKISRFIQCVGK